MKKYILILLFTVISSYTFTQHEVKLNAFGAIYGNYGGAYEYIINKTTGINIHGGYFIVPKKLKSDITSFGVAIEYRKYFKDKEVSATGFWGSPYIKYTRTVMGKESFIFKFIEEIIKQKTSISKIIQYNIGLGYSIGLKGYVDNIFYYEPYLGLGLNLYEKTYYLTNSSDKIATTSNKDKSPIEFRFGINVGYRFGSNR